MHLESLRLKYRKITTGDINYIMSLEAEEENKKYICPSATKQHLEFAKDPEVLYLIILEKDRSQPIGFVLLSGLNSANRSMELRRVVISEKGMGYGREVINIVKEYCFNQLRCHRLWLDVFDFNHRAISLYKSEGFKEEGMLRESVYKDGEYKNLILLGMLENEYVIH